MIQAKLAGYVVELVRRNVGTAASIALAAALATSGCGDVADSTVTEPNSGATSEPIARDATEENSVSAQKINTAPGTLQEETRASASGDVH